MQYLQFQSHISVSQNLMTSHWKSQSLLNLCNSACFSSIQYTKSLNAHHLGPIKHIDIIISDCTNINSTKCRQQYSYNCSPGLLVFCKYALGTLGTLGDFGGCEIPLLSALSVSLIRSFSRDRPPVSRRIPDLVPCARGLIMFSKKNEPSPEAAARSSSPSEKTSST